MGVCPSAQNKRGTGYSSTPRLLLSLKPFGTAHERPKKGFVGGKARFIKRDAELGLSKIEEIDPVTGGGNVVFQIDNDDRLFAYSFGDPAEKLRAVMEDLRQALLADSTRAEVLRKRK